MKRAIVHIGTHKTGTTSLQHFLLENEELLNAHAMCFPATKKKFPRVGFERNAYFITQYVEHALGLQDAENIEATIEENALEVKRCIEECDTIVLSDEKLWYVGANQSETWRLVKSYLESLGVTDFTIVVYLRRQDLWAYSYWNQQIKQSTTSKASFGPFVEAPRIRNAMDYDAGLRKLEDTFGKDNIVVRVFERDRLVGGDTVLDFCSALGIDTSSISYSREASQRNDTGLTGMLVEIKRQANHVPEYRGTDNFLRRAAISASGVSKKNDKSSFLSPEISEEIMARYAQGNARVARDYLGDSAARLFSDEPVPRRAKPMSGHKDFARDTVRFFTAAIAQEHVQRLGFESNMKSEIARLNKELASAKRETADLSKELSNVKKNLGILYRICRKIRSMRAK